MRSRGWILLTMLLALAPLPVRAAEQGRTQWKLGSFTWVKRVPAEPGAPANAQPAVVPEGAFQELLGRVQARDDGKDVPLFGADELQELSKVLSKAFALAQPGEDLVLLTTSRHSDGFMSGLMERATALTARLFVREGALNLIVHDTRREFMDQYVVDNLEPTFVYGSRSKASAALLQAPQATCLRGDWLALPLPAAPLAALPPAAVPPAAVPPPAAPAVPAPPAKPAEPARNPASYEAQAERLRALKRLREENLISEAEYQAKREAILKEL